MIQPALQANGAFIVGGIIILFFTWSSVLLAALGLDTVPDCLNNTRHRSSIRSPSADYWLGTDQFRARCCQPHHERWGTNSLQCCGAVRCHFDPHRYRDRLDFRVHRVDCLTQLSCDSWMYLFAFPGLLLALFDCHHIGTGTSTTPSLRSLLFTRRFLPVLHADRFCQSKKWNS